MSHEESCEGPSSTDDIIGRQSETQNRDRILHQTEEEETTRGPASSRGLSLSQSEGARPSVIPKFVASQDDTSFRRGAHRLEEMDHDENERYGQVRGSAHGSVAEDSLYMKAGPRDALDEGMNSHPFVVTCAQVGQISYLILLVVL